MQQRRMGQMLCFLQPRTATWKLYNCCSMLKLTPATPNWSTPTAPFIDAALRNHLKVVRWLLQAGADKDSSFSSYRTTCEFVHKHLGDHPVTFGSPGLRSQNRPVKGYISTPKGSGICSGFVTWGLFLSQNKLFLVDSGVPSRNLNPLSFYLAKLQCC